MAKYLPFAGKNSIQEAVIAIHFAGEIDASVIESAFNRSQADLKNDFPAGNLIQMMAIRVPANVNARPDTHLMQPQVGGFELSRPSANGSPARVLRLTKDLLSVNYMEYDSWDISCPQSIQYIRHVLEQLELVKNPVAAFSLRYIDRFTFDGPPDEANANLLFVENNKYITARSFEAKTMWHSHSGWFEKVGDDGSRILNQLNIGSTVIDQTPSVTIDHNAVCQLTNHRQSVGTLLDEVSSISILMEPALKEMHMSNQIILKNLLLPDMLDKIGLESEN